MKIELNVKKKRHTSKGGTDVHFELYVDKVYAGFLVMEQTQYTEFKHALVIGCDSLNEQHNGK